MNVPIEEGGVIRGYVSLEGAEEYCLGGNWLEMLYRLPDGHWVRYCEDPPDDIGRIAHFVTEAEALDLLLGDPYEGHLAELTTREWFRRLDRQGHRERGRGDPPGGE